MCKPRVHVHNIALTGELHTYPTSFYSYLIAHVYKQRELRTLHTYIENMQAHFHIPAHICKAHNLYPYTQTQLTHGHTCAHMPIYNTKHAWTFWHTYKQAKTLQTHEQHFWTRMHTHKHSADNTQIHVSIYA